MGIILLSLLIVLVIAALVYFVDKGNGDESVCAAVGAIISSLILGLILLVTVLASYSSYVHIRTQYDATIGQYREAVTMYKDNAAIDVDKAAFTDLKYQGYQENMSDFIKDLRKQIASYNQELVSKRIMKKNWFFSWVIVAPDDDMKMLCLTK